MQGLYFLLALAGVGVVIHWLLLYDGKGNDGALRGLLAMKRATPIVKRTRRKRKAWQHPAEREDAAEPPEPMGGR